jgi:hypothetical protein
MIRLMLIIIATAVCPDRIDKFLVNLSYDYRLKLPLLNAYAANKPDCIGPNPKRCFINVMIPLKLILQNC